MTPNGNLMTELSSVFDSGIVEERWGSYAAFSDLYM
jgi:hypothetical protein